MRGERSVPLWYGIITLGVLAILYFGHCTGQWGKRGGLLHYLLQCACPRSMENARVRKLYSEHAEIMFPACGPEIGPIPSPSGRKIAVINFEQPDQSYVWFLQTDERISFSWLDGSLDWLTDDLLIVRTWYAMNIVDLDARVEHSLPVRADIRLDSEKITPSVVSALRKARYVILAKRMVAVISPDALVSPEHTFIILYYDEFAHILADAKSDSERYERMRQFLRDQDIDYLDYIVRSGTDVLSINPYQKYGIEPGDPYPDVVSPDGRFFYRASSEDGIYLVETGEKIADWHPNWYTVDWVYDGVLVNPGGTSLIDTFIGSYHIGLCGISEPWLKIRVPSEYDVSDTSPD